jgi:protein TonB
MAALLKGRHQSCEKLNTGPLASGTIQGKFTHCVCRTPIVGEVVMSKPDVLYGAYELKRSYQSHLGWGIAIGATLHVAAILSFLHFVRTGEVPVLPTAPIEPITDGVSDVDRPRVIDWERAGMAAKPTVPSNPELSGIPVAAPDEEFALDYSPPRPNDPLDEARGLNMPAGFGAGAGNGSGGHGSGTAGSNAEPLPGVFVAVEAGPVRVKHVTPDFPEMARLIGREGRVVVRALVDRDGTVRRAEIAKSSGTNVGFDEAAVDAALRCLYKPAIQNGMPVMVWVTYVVEFKLR